MLDIILEQTTVTAVEVLVGALIGGLISSLITRIKNHKSLEDKIEDLTKAIKENRNQLRQEIDNVRCDLLNEINKIKEAEAASLRYVIRQACKVKIKEGYVELDEKADLLNCYERYEAVVSSNGVIDDLIQKIRELPHEIPDEEDN